MPKPRAIPAWPRALCEGWAAVYVGQLSVSAFRTEVGAGRIPAAVQITSGRKAWLIEDLDAYLDGKAGKRSAPADALPDNLVAEWDMACDGAREPRLS